MAKPKSRTAAEIAAMGSDGDDGKGGTTAMLDGTQVIDPKPEHVQVRVFVTGAQKYNAKGVDGLAMSDRIPFWALKGLAATQGPITDEQLGSLFGQDGTVPAELKGDDGTTPCSVCEKGFVPFEWSLVVKDTKSGAADKYIVLTDNAGNPVRLGNFVARYNADGRVIVMAGCGSPNRQDSCLSYLRTVKGVKEGTTEPVMFPDPLKAGNYASAKSRADYLDGQAQGRAAGNADRLSRLGGLVSRPKGLNAGPGSHKGNLGGWTRKPHGGR